MKSKLFKRALSLTIAAAMAGVMLAGCNGGTATTSEPSQTGSSSASSASSVSAPKDKENVLLWHLWTGDEAGYVQNAVDYFNEHNDKYFVESVSTPDMQKIMIAIQAGNGPDVTDDFSSNVGSYADKGIVLNLDDYIANDPSFDKSAIIPSAYESCMYNGSVWALPCGLNPIALFYNKTLLAEAGITEPPQTMEEMLETAIQTTKVNSDGTIDTLGWISFPTDYITGSMLAAYGGSWWTEDAKPASPDNKANLAALQMNIDYITKFGVENVAKFQASGKYNDPADPFVQGKQVFRLDGNWLGDTIANRVKADVDYGVTYMPYPKGQEDLKNSSCSQSSIYYIPANSKCKDGAWEFLKYICGEQGEKIQSLATGGYPTITSLLDTPEFAKGMDSAFFKELGTNGRIVSDPASPKTYEYNTIIKEETELAYNLKQTAQEALDNIYKRAMADVFN